MKADNIRNQTTENGSNSTYIIVENENNGTKEIHGCYHSLEEAEGKLKSLKSDYDINYFIGDEEDSFQIENDYGDIITYQIFEVPCN